MNLFGENVKQSNVPRIILLAALSVLWRILAGDFYEGPQNKYVFPVLAFGFISVLVGELTRKIFRLFFKEKGQVVKTTDQTESEEVENGRDTDALNFSLMWAVIFILITVLI